MVRGFYNHFKCVVDEMKSEAEIQAQIINMIHACFPNAYYFKVHDELTEGLPDIIGCLRGRFFAIEIKSEKGTLKRNQDMNLRLIKMAEGCSMVARSPQEAKEFLTNLEKDVLRHG